jgi:hypothetical protein
MKYVALLLPLLLCGCFETVPVRPTIPEKTSVNVPPEDLRACPALPRMEERDYTQDQLADFFKDWINAHDTCDGRQARLAAIIRKAFNLPETSAESSAK